MSSYNNRSNVVPQVGFEEGMMYANLTPSSIGKLVESLFPLNPLFYNLKIHLRSRRHKHLYFTVYTRIFSPQNI